jgi:hypothetical protein
VAIYWDNTLAYPFQKVGLFMPKIERVSIFPNLPVLLTLAKADHFLFPILKVVPAGRIMSLGKFMKKFEGVIRTEDDFAWGFKR